MDMNKEFQELQTSQNNQPAFGKKRSGASVNVYLILRQNDKLLLHLRKNTGYCDGQWSLVAGHVEDNESATAALIREANEEIGIELIVDHIRIAHLMHRKSDRLNIDIFFECQSWNGAIQNCEQQKCEKLAFFTLDAMPENTVDYIKKALNHISQNDMYSEHGWAN